MCAFPTRAQAVGSWSMDTCCQGSGNYCHYSDGYDYCLDHTSSADFLFRLQPGDPQRFLPKPGGDTDYQYIRPYWWPRWGFHSDLSMGYTGPLGGTGGRCDRGSTYAGSPNEACGGNHWGKTDFEAWRLAD